MSVVILLVGRIDAEHTVDIQARLGQEGVMHDVPFEHPRLFDELEVRVHEMPIVPFGKRRQGHDAAGVGRADLFQCRLHRLARGDAVVHQQNLLGVPWLD